MRISDWSSDVCSSDLGLGRGNLLGHVQVQHGAAGVLALQLVLQLQGLEGVVGEADRQLRGVGVVRRLGRTRLEDVGEALAVFLGETIGGAFGQRRLEVRSEEQTSELQSLMPNSYA